MAETKAKAKATEATKTKESPKRVYFNETVFNASKAIFEPSLGILQSIIDRYEELGAGKPDKKVFQAVLQEGFMQAAKQAYMKKMDADIKETTKNTLLAGKLRTMVEEPFDNWAEKAREARDAVYNLSLGLVVRTFFDWSYFQFENGKVTYNVKALEDKCSTFADTDNRKKFLDLAEKTEKQLQELQSMAGEYSDVIIPGSAYTGYLFNSNSGSIKLDPAFLGAIK
jgi:hypothetical protein